MRNKFLLIKITLLVSFTILFLFWFGVDYFALILTLAILIVVTPDILSLITKRFINQDLELEQTMSTHMKGENVKVEMVRKKAY